jgi:hypothetical protein
VYQSTVLFRGSALCAALLVSVVMLTPIHGAAELTRTPLATRCIAITSPANRSRVSGSGVSINTSDSCSGIWFEALRIDGRPSGAFAPGQVVFDSTTVANGYHLITVTSQSANPGSVVLAKASEYLTVNNGGTPATPTPGPTATPKPPTPIPTASSTPGGHVHYSMLSPGAALPSESACAAQVDASPIGENAPWNQNDGMGFNSNRPPAGGVPGYFYQNAPCCSELPHSDFATVDGAYSGSTDNILRVYACKWGIDEDYVRAQAWVESAWHQDCAAAHGGGGCAEGGDQNSPPGCTSGLPSTAITPGGQFCAMQGFGGLSGSNQFDSWSIVQSKVYYQWMAWPMVEESTPFGVDFRYAEMRGCVNGDQFSYYNSQSSSSGADYQRAVSAAQSNPNGASNIPGWSNLDYLAYGCIESHFSGDWYSGNMGSYLSSFLNALNNAPWPGGNR